MPLIRAIVRFFHRRLDTEYASFDDARRTDSRPMTPETVRYGGTFRDNVAGFGSYGGELGGALWIGLMVVAVPLILFLVLVGLIYELVVRLGRRRLPPLSDWTLSLMAAVALVGVGGSWVISRI